MTDAQDTQGTTGDGNQTTANDKGADDKGADDKTTTDPRETPAFRGVIKQLAERDAKIEALAKKLEKVEAIEEAKKIKINEEAGKYEENLAIKEAKIKELLDAQTALTARVERERIESDVRVLLSAKAVPPKAQAFLIAEYLSTDADERKAPDEWVKAVSEDEEYSPFFGVKSKAAGAVAPRASSASNGTKTNMSEAELLAAGDSETQRAVFERMINEDPG